MTFSRQYLDEAVRVVQELDADVVERAVGVLAAVRARGGRLFVLGVGGGAANAAHAVNDFRMLAGLEAYAPTDNVAELTARVNDHGWSTVFADWLKASRLGPADAVLVLSVGGGDIERNISPNLVVALRYAKEVGARVLGIVGRREGFTAQTADVCVVVPAVSPERLTPHAETVQALVWHLMVSHPALRSATPKWESAR